MKRGFTIIELLTSIAILAVLVMLLTANFYRGGLIGDLRTSSQELAGQIRRMQTIATSGQTAIIDGSEQVPTGGYGINFEYAIVLTPVTTYRSFADIARVMGSSCIALQPNDDDGVFNEMCDIKLQTFLLRSYVRIPRFQVDDEIPVELDNIPGQGVSIVFKPPKPTPKITTVSGVSGYDPERWKRVRIELFHERANAYRTITVNSASGQISETTGCIEEIRELEGYAEAPCGSYSP